MANVTLEEVAKDAGVSIATVCKVLNPGHKDYRVSARCVQRVLDSVKRLGYTPNYHAQAMKRGKSQVIAFALDIPPNTSPDPGANQLGTAYFGSIFGAIEMHLRARGYFTTVIGPDGEQRAFERGLLGLKQQRFDGMIVLDSAALNWSMEFKENASELPIVLLKHAGAAQIPVVDFDEKQAIALAVKHLAELGHRDFLWVGPAESMAREHLFMTAIWDAGLRGASCRIPGNETIYIADAVPAAGASIARFLTEKAPPFTAVVCYNDVVAMGVYTALSSQGMAIPNDASVIGFDDAIAWFSQPGLTTISQRLPQLGVRAAELVLELIADRDARKKWRGQREVLAPKLVVRQSTGPAPKETRTR